MLDKPNLSEAIVTASEAVGVADAEAGPPLLRAGRLRPSRVTKPFALSFLLTLAAYVAARVWDLTSYGLFSDEIFSVWVAGNGWRELMALVVEDVVHPPLFYLLLKAWVLAGGDSLLWMKLFPVTLSVAAIIPFFLLCRELKLKAAAINLAFALMAVNEYLITYSQELRMYSLLMLLTLASIWLFAAFFNAPTPASGTHAALLAANLLLVYTHYYGWLVVGVEFLSLLLWNREKLPAFSLSLAALFACFIPWAYAVSQAAVKKGGLSGNLGWNRPPDFEHFSFYFAVLAGGLEERWKYFGANLDRMVSVFPKLALLFSLPVLLWGWRATRRAKGRPESVTFWWLAALSFLPAIISFWASRALPHSIWAVRYLIISAPPFMLLLAAACMKLDLKWLRATTAVLLLGWSALSGFVQMSHRDAVAYEPIARRLMGSESERPAATKIYTDNYNMASTLNFYLEKADDKVLRAAWVNDYSEAGGDQFWVAFMKYAPEAQEEIEAEFKNRGYEVSEGFKVEAFTYEVVLLRVAR
ncbi:MAG TPA: hypothetical protein VNI02_10420 [Blastocatellia bacterium]|nr:hypothetical protein [Blastocatellia bacterium]